MVLVKNVMSRPVVTVQSSADVARAARLMKESRISSLIVVDSKDRPLGIVTETDIIYKVVAGNKPLKTRVEQVMTADLKTITEEETVEQAAKLMAAHRIRRLPVMLDRNLVGIITLKDVVKSKKVNNESEYYPYFT